MKYIVAAIVLSCVCAGLAFFYLGANDTESSDPASPGTEPAELQADLERTEAGRAALQEELSEAREQIRQLEVKAVETDSLVEELKFAATESAAKTEEPAEASDEDEPTREGEEESKDKPTLDEIVTKMRENSVAKVQIQAMTGLVFADFLNSVQLDPDMKTEVREVLGDSFLEGQALAQYALLQEDVTWREVTEWGLDNRALLNDQLKELLPDDAFETWNEFAADIDAHVLDSTLRNQVRMLAGGLTPENFETVMGVAVEEFRAEQVALEQSDTLFTMSENIYYQFRAMDAMRERLQESLPEDQFAEVQNFFAFAENALNAQLPKEGQGE